EVEDAFVAAQHGVEAALAELIQASMPGLAMRAQEARGHHRRQRQRDHHRDADRHREHDREFTEQAADDAAHQQQRDQHRHQRNADRHDRETDFARALEGGGHRPFAFLDIARDVFHHHDGVVHDEADRDRQGHQREIVQRIAEHPHQRASAEQGQRHGDCGNHGGPEAAQEDEDHHDHEENGQQQRKLYVLDRGADGLGAVGDDLDLDRRRDRGNEARQQRLDLVDGLDDVGARLLEHHQEHATLAVGPGRLLGVFRAGHGASDAADPQRAAVAVGDDDVIPLVGVEQLVVGVDRVGPPLAVDIALRAIDSSERDLTANVLQRQNLGHELGRIELDADRWLLLAADDDLGNTRDLADLLGELGVD